MGINLHPMKLSSPLGATRAFENETGFREQFRVKGRDGQTILAAAEARFLATFEQAAVGIAQVGTAFRPSGMFFPSVG